jgi:predicted nucleic acid-binding protein
MKSVGLDTCVILRLLIGEPDAQAKQARKYLEDCYLSGVIVYITDLVVAETYHALCHHYSVPSQEATDVLSEFLASPMVTPSGHALTVLCEYQGIGAGFVDRLIRSEVLEKAQEIVTFDKKFAQLPNVIRLT